MPQTAERFCNLTLSRAEWSALVKLLEQIRHPCSVGARQAIRDALNADPEAASVSIDRECEKWSTVLNAVWEVAMHGGPEGKRVVHAMTCQISAARFTRVW